MARERRIFDEAFKTNALNLLEVGRTAAAVAKELDLSVELLYRWRKERIVKSAPGTQTNEELHAELRAMKKRAERAEMEAAILKQQFQFSARYQQRTEAYVHP